jgi:glycosyltransferase involved in cell wall biosynthesis
MSVIKAFQKLQEKNIPIHLTIIGDGILKDEIEKYISNHKIVNIELLGKISQSQVMEEYSKAHILIAPSREEAMSISVLEAVSCGLYVLATRISGNIDVLLENVNGNFVEYGNAENIASKICSFYNEKFLHNYQYPDLMMKFILQNYSWEITAEKYCSYLSKAISDN